MKPEWIVQTQGLASAIGRGTSPLMAQTNSGWTSVEVFSRNPLAACLREDALRRRESGAQFESVPLAVQA